MTYYTIYQITNQVNSKTYIGVHKTDNLEDGYMGSGKYLNNAYKKYGIENFQKEILEIYNSSEEMFDAESILVNEEFVSRKDTYNLKEGGFGGFDYINNNGLNNALENGVKGGIATKERLVNDPVLRESYKYHYKKRTSDERKASAKRAKETEIKRYGKCHGTKHTAETKKKMSNAKKGKRTGTENSQYGTCWIYNLDLKENKKIQKDNLNIYLDQGWIKGCIRDFEKYFEKEKKRAEKDIAKRTEKRKLELKNQHEAQELYRIYKESEYNSMRSFAKSDLCCYDSSRLWNLWKKYIPGY